VLTSLLPGVRELRAPLAAGYLWLLLVWLTVAGSLPNKREAHGSFERLYDLEPLVSTVGIAVVASVGAYLVGSLAIDAQVFLGQVALYLLDKAGGRARWIGSRIGPGWFSAEHSERETRKVRLLVLAPAWHAEVDRPDSEATLCMALWPPVTALVVYLGSTISLPWFAALLIPAAIGRQWISRRRRADIALREALDANPEI
jgi:hypothetical protein